MPLDVGVRFRQDHFLVDGVTVPPTKKSSFSVTDTLDLTVVVPFYHSSGIVMPMWSAMLLMTLWALMSFTFH